MIRPNGRGQFEGFNSMIVRLKARRRCRGCLTGIRFQFYDSPIKSLNSEALSFMLPIGFNSMIVRLKEEIRN